MRFVAVQAGEDVISLDGGGRCLVWGIDVNDFVAQPATSSRTFNRRMKRSWRSVVFFDSILVLIFQSLLVWHREQAPPVGELA